jgi:hypothetical protein
MPYWTKSRMKKADFDLSVEDFSLFDSKAHEKIPRCDYDDYVCCDCVYTRREQPQCPDYREEETW